MIKAVPKSSFNFSLHWGKSLSHFPVCRHAVTRASSSHPFLGMPGKTTRVQRSPLPFHFTTVSNLPSSSSNTVLLYWKWERKSPWSGSNTKGGAGDTAPPFCFAFNCTKRARCMTQKVHPIFMAWRAGCTCDCPPMLHSGTVSSGQGQPQSRKQHSWANYPSSWRKCDDRICPIYPLFLIFSRTSEHCDWPWRPQTQWKQCRFKTGDTRAFINHRNALLSW